MKMTRRRRCAAATALLVLPIAAIGASALRGRPDGMDREQSERRPESTQQIHGGANIFRDRPERQRRPHEPSSGSNTIERTPQRTAGRPTRYFSTLQCNIDSDLSTNPCTDTWTTLFGRNYVYKSTVVIPCGKCVTMDLGSPFVTLEQGIDIQGKLLVPDGYKSTIKTPFVRVQGELHISSSKIPDGTPDLRVIMTGTDDQLPMFQPADSNSDICGGQFCSVGKKPFVVAGGRLKVEALKPDTPTWVRLHDVVGNSAIVLPRLVRQRWGQGSEVLITSHTLSYDDEQVRRIVGYSEYAKDPDYVTVQLDRSIRRPTTMLDAPDFAVEVALLSRNVVFEGDNDDSNPRHGGHLIVYGTPLVQQKLEGVEVRNFGQQGTLGRYPIHFHMCNDVTGSIVSKNVIRESNQRCVVVHGTHNLTVDSNVAYDTHGHCFMTEDGNEQGNVFRGNLGALTLPVRDVIPDMGSNGEETDDKPSTFWMTNPTNTWEGNVAAGSEFSGFWLELRPRVRGPSARLAPDLNPMKAPLTLFKDNVAHSNRDKGIRTYPDGFMPEEEAVFYGSRVYRNEGDGLWLHHTHNVAVDGGVYADNRRQVDFDRADKIKFRNARIIGISSNYHFIMDTQSVPGICTTKKALAGIQFHSFTRRSNTGAAIENITLSGFADSGCSKVAAFDFDDQIERGSFDFFTAIKNVTLERGTIPINFCEADRVGIHDIYITDLDSSARPATSRFRGTSSIVSISPGMTTFLSNCVSLTDQCYAYCEGACLRTVTYTVDPAGTEGYKLRICRETEPSSCIEASDTFYYNEKSNDMETILYNTQYSSRRSFAVSLPRGSYVAKFLDSDGNDAWPTFAHEVYEVELCPESLMKGSILVEAPSVNAGTCASLIRNGNADESLNHTHWLHRKGGIAVAAGEGIDATNAFMDIKQTDKDKDGIAQFLDSRCVSAMVGRQYEIQAWVKLVEGDALHLCDVNQEDCPEVDIFLYSGIDSTYRKTAAETVVSYSSEIKEGYQLVHGVLDMTSRFASATSVMFSVQRNVRKVAMYVDNVSLELLPSNCEAYNLVRNPKFEYGDSRFWQYKKRTLSMVMLDGSNYAARSRDGELYQYITTGCMSLGESYVANARFQLVAREDGRPLVCTDAGLCPVLKLKAKANGSTVTRTIATTELEVNGDWYTMRGTFTADELLSLAESLRLSFDDVPRLTDMIVAEVSVQKDGVL